ncbi:divalent-cation tolerance protein CutA [Phycicoccus sp. HDW14]|uniref:divalent-cation tolerance protein CutA n=1 Tax=Phycicoccus sp. HDW14 TaxID=2714941 RepID=UPI00140ABB82|nr:divalent-cation tolerance protein CutA [Phycicoccus sp. HDW14]QIM22181.1 divalent-cation tolerance protein CutA [Phycicoccus sp. HDW14]
MNDVVEVIVTGPPDFMQKLVETLIGERLIACGQLAPIMSTYRWQGAVENATEVRAILHTTRECSDLVMRRIQEEHPYEVPCILISPVMAGNSRYLAWVAQETHKGPSSS